MGIKTNYLRHKNKWSAFTTLNGVDIQEYGDNEKAAKDNLTKRISKSEFLLSGISIPYTPKVGDVVLVPMKIGKKGVISIVEGVVKTFSKSIMIDGEKTVLVSHLDYPPAYYPISKVTLKQTTL